MPQRLKNLKRALVPEESAIDRDGAPFHWCWPDGQGSKPSALAESELDSVGRTLAASIQTVQSATASLQGAASLNSMLARADEAADLSKAREAAARSLPAPQGIQELNTTLQIDSISGKT